MNMRASTGAHLALRRRLRACQQQRLRRTAMREAQRAAFIESVFGVLPVESYLLLLRARWRLSARLLTDCVSELMCSSADWGPWSALGRRSGVGSGAFPSPFFFFTGAIRLPEHPNIHRLTSRGPQAPLPKCMVRSFQLQELIDSSFTQLANEMPAVLSNQQLLKALGSEEQCYLTTKGWPQTRPRAAQSLPAAAASLSRRRRARPDSPRGAGGARAAPPQRRQRARACAR